MSDRPDMAGAGAADALAAVLAPALGHAFRQADLLQRALTHASCNQVPAAGAASRRGGAGARSDYDRLEFLGDRVLALVITERLFARYPKADAGELARRLNALVRQESLASVAQAVPLGPHIAMSPDMREAGGAENPSILADVCEAVIAALYLDGGMPVARDFILARFEPLLDQAPTDRKDAKTRLQEWAAGRGHAMPVYEDRRSGPAHAPVFAVTVHIPGLSQSMAEGEGRSKRAAQQMAAAAALKRLNA